MPSISGSLICPVCGYPHLPRPAFSADGLASFEICPCCTTHFGYDDAKQSHGSLRAAWIAEGAQWRGRAEARPPDWSAPAQLRAAGLVPDAS